VHNYIDTALLERDSRSKLKDAVLEINNVWRKQQGLPADDAQQSSSQKLWLKRARRSLIMAEAQPYLT
jgi:hypothetical protein